MQPDDQLIARVVAGDLEAFGAIVDRYRAKAFTLAYRMLGSRDRADDVAQDAFLRAFNALGRFDASRPFLPWILAITANLCKDDLRRRRLTPIAPTPPEDLAESPADGGDPYASARQAEVQAAVGEAVAKLPTQQRLATILIHLQGLSYEQASEALGQPVNTVKSHVHRARARLRQLLAPHLKEDVR